MTKIVVLDGHAENPGDLSWAGLEAFGEFRVYDDTAEKDIAATIGDADIVFVNKTKLTRGTLYACPNIRFIGVLATGYNIVDVAAAKERGIVVSNVPTYGSYAVGQFAIALLLEICHHIGHHDKEVKAGRWSESEWCFWDYPLIELYGKTMGIIGFGRIGQVTGRIAKAMGMEVIAYDSHQDPALRDEGFSYVTLDELLRRSDVVSLHCPLFPETKGIINRHTIAKMKDGVILLNNSRGPLVVDADLADALNSGKVYAAGLDVISKEPIDPDNPLLKAKNCFITPHISWAPRESRKRLMETATENLRQFLNGTPVNVVNP
ncbi:MAG TPA: D-2-hydroxyacid dehydrogenase [Feifaniaceae bacterium]|nr:D-2-hydroxyacid dehydrogenase [Feifaniaceae bacterium]